MLTGVVFVRDPSPFPHSRWRRRLGSWDDRHGHLGYLSANGVSPGMSFFRVLAHPSIWSLLVVIIRSLPRATVEMMLPVVDRPKIGSADVVQQVFI